MRQLFHSAGLAVALASCGGSTAVGDTDTGDGAGASGDVVDPMIEAAPAILYRVGYRDGPGGELWLHPRGADGERLGASDVDGPGNLCVNPDGSGFATWGLDRTQTFHVDGSGPVELFPDEAFPFGCPMGWSSTAFYVNLAFDPVAREAALPHRVSVVGPSVEATLVDGASVAWDPLGGLALERRPSDIDASQYGEVVAWSLQNDAVVAASWQGSPFISVREVGPWLLIDRWAENASGARTSWRAELAPAADPAARPVVLEPGANTDIRPTVIASPSGEYVIYMRSAESRFELLRIEGDVIASRAVVPALDEPPETSSFEVSDAGALIYSTGGVLSALWSDGRIEVLAYADDDPEPTYVGGFVLHELDAVHVIRGGGGLQRSSLRPLAGGEEVMLPVPEDCSFVGPDNTLLFFSCGEGSGLIVDPANPQAEPMGLDALLPTPDALLREVLAIDWDGERWQRLAFATSLTAYTMVLVEPNTRETITLRHPSTAWTFVLHPE